GCLAAIYIVFAVGLLASVAVGFMCNGNFATAETFVRLSRRPLMNLHQRPDKAAERATKKAVNTKQPPQVQGHQPGVESEMRPQPQYMPKYPGVGKLRDKVAVITGGDSG